MSRRHAAKQDSLELLLDTICNTFGGVLFIAILVVLLLQQTGTGPTTVAPPAPPLSPVEMQELTSRMELVTEELTRLRQNRDSQDAVVQTFAPEAIRQLLATRAAATTEQEALQSEVDQLLASNTELVARVETLAVENAAVHETLEEARARFEAAQLKLDQSRQSRTQEARMPVVRSAGAKTEIGLVLRYGRMYVWHKYSEGLWRGGLNTDDFVIVSTELGGIVTRPKPNAGTALEDSAASRAAVRKILKQFRPDMSILAIIVRPDSYDAFKYVRDTAIELGFEYRLMPADTDTAIYDRGGSGGSVQ